MPVHFLKKASKNSSTNSQDVAKKVQDILNELEAGGESKVLEYAKKFDGWEKEVIVSRKEIEEACQMIPDQLKEDIKFAHEQVKKFAEKQRESMKEFECELYPGLITGQKLVPVKTAGCYVPGGRFAHIASAVMSITTAKVAGVKHIVACSPPHKGKGLHPAILFAMDLCGADTILCLGGIQAIASMAFGFFTNQKADILVGPGNQYVAEAKRILFGRCGIDIFAGPTEILIIADKNADPNIVASDLVGQAEHGINSPAILITTSKELGEKVMEIVPKLIEDLKPTAAEDSWRDYGEVVLVDTREEAVQLSDEYSPEHLEVIHDDPHDLGYWLKNLTNYGSLFLGEEATVAYGDKTSGPNHILPTKKVADYSGGLYVGKFIKVLTYQRMNKEATKKIAPVTARISRFEGMEAHARTADDRLRKYFPEETFETIPKKMKM